MLSKLLLREIYTPVKKQLKSWYLQHSVVVQLLLNNLECLYS